MQLNSAIFIVFLAVTAAVYYLVPHKFRNPLLLLASYVFYLWAVPQYAIFLVFSTVLSYVAARTMSAKSDSNQKKIWLIASIVINLAILAFFKYFGFFTDTLSAAGFVTAESIPTLVMPIGISFYTFQIIGYNIDVYRGTIEPERDFITFALFVGFFPAIVAGPIGRAGELLPQYKQEHKLDYTNIIDGLQRFLTGALKKVVIADGLSFIVNGIYNTESLPKYSGLTLLIAVVLYTIELYFDFAGYTDMAVGVAKIFGFTLRENFKAPYLATNISGFWSRWHMSLTTWFRDYVYIPLGGNRKGFARKLINIAIIFVLSGIWHGSTMNFVIWGAMHGVARIGEELLNRTRFTKKTKADGFVARNLKRLGVVGWWGLSLIFFRAETFSDALYVIKNIPRMVPLRDTLDIVLHYTENGISNTGTYYLIFFGILALSLIIMACFDRRIYPKDASYNALATYKKKTRWLLYWILGFSVIIFYFIALTSESGIQSFAYGNF